MGAVLLSLTAFSLLLLTAADHKHLPQVRESSQKYCGKALTETLSFLCNGIYNKRTDPLSHNSIENEVDTVMDGFKSIRDLFRSRENAMSMTGHRRFREKRQLVVDECCRKSCTISELMSYCGSEEKEEEEEDRQRTVYRYG